MRKETEDSAAWVVKAIREYIDSSENTMKNEANERAWGEPLVGFSRGDDPLYEAYKEHVGPFHYTPAEFFGRTFPDVTFETGDLTVISWVLPQTEKTKADEHRNKTRYPSERWARARIFGEEINEKLRSHVVEVLRKEGIDAVSPMLSPLWSRKESERFVFASNWSERHAAYAGGLGTFGLCDGLITPRGKAMRLGSVIARIRIPPTPRPYNDYREYCLFFSRGTCGECIKRCPAEALSEKGHDKLKCRAYVTMTRKYVPEHYGFEGYGCGFCQTGVPCESRIPDGG